MNHLQRKAFAQGELVPMTAFWKVHGEYQSTCLPDQKWKPLLLFLVTRSRARDAIRQRRDMTVPWVYRNLRIEKPT